MGIKLQEGWNNMSVKVGQEMVMVLSKRRGSEIQVIEVRVTRVGTKFFYVAKEGGKEFKFNKNDFRYEGYSGYSSTGVTIHKSMQEYENYKEKRKLQDEVWTYFSDHGERMLTLDQLRKIKETINVTITQ